MIGQIKLGAGGWGSPEWGRLYGLPVLRASIDPAGWMQGLRLRRAGRVLCHQGITRALMPMELDRQLMLREYGVAPISPEPLLRSQSDRIAIQALKLHGQDPAQAVVALRGQRADRDMARTAAQLCRQVRSIIVEAPRGGEELSAWLRSEFGIPVLPPAEKGEVGLHFGESAQREESALCLYGTEPDLGGVRISAPCLEAEDQEDLPLLAVLWASGTLPAAELNIT